MLVPCWTPVALPPEPAVLATDGQTVWAAQASGAVFVSGDAGRAWTAAPSGPLHPEPFALLAAPGGLFAATESGVFHAPHAEPWRSASAGLPADDLVTTLVDAGTCAVAGTLSSGLFRWSPEREGWVPLGAVTPLHTGRRTVFALASGERGLYAAHPLGLSRSTDAGRTWEGASFGLPPSVLVNALFVSGSVWASGGGAVFRSDDGLNWQSVYAPGTDLPLVLIARAPRLLVARETSGTRLYGSHDGGITWKAFGQGLPSESFVTGGVCVAETLLLSTLPEGLWRCDVPAVSAQPAPLELLPQPPTSRGDVSFALRAAAHVVLSVHDVAGAEVARLVDGVPPQGQHTCTLASTLPPGLYEWRLRGGGTSQARSFIFLP